MSFPSLVPSFIFTLLLIVAGPVIGKPVRIELLESVGVASRVVTLGQVAHITSTDLDLVRRLVVLPLGTAPVTDAFVKLDRAVLSRWIRARAGLATSDVAWEGEEQVVVFRLSQQVRSEELVNLAHSKLSDWLTERSDRFEIRPVSPTRNLQVPDGTVRLLVRPITYDRPVRRMQVWVEARNEEGVHRAVPILFDVSAYATAAVVRRDLSPGNAEVQSFSDQEIELTALPTKSRTLNIAQVSALDSPRLRRPLKSGDVVTVSDVETAPAVRRGEQASLLLMNGPLTLESRVEVLNDAGIGQEVRVRAAQANGPFVVRVTGRGQVEVKP
jgi:flagella basal body P-ring formation protein FlgA